MMISMEGPCVIWQNCLKVVGKTCIEKWVVQEQWLSSHETFLSGGRLYADIKIHNRPLIMDAVTGTLFFPSGRCIGTPDLNVNVKDKNYDKVDVHAFVKQKY